VIARSAIFKQPTTTVDTSAPNGKTPVTVAAILNTLNQNVFDLKMLFFIPLTPSVNSTQIAMFVGALQSMHPCLDRHARDQK